MSHNPSPLLLLLLKPPPTTTTTPLKSPPYQQQIRHATLIRRPRRPYTFTQLVTLSDGSTYTHRTTSPIPVYHSSKDTRNTPLWNPSSQKLLNVEADEAGKLRAFRAKFGRGWDASRTAEVRDVVDGGTRREEQVPVGEDARVTKGQRAGGDDGDDDGDGGDNLMDLISGYGREGEVVVDAGADGKGKGKGKGKKGEGGKK